MLGRFSEADRLRLVLGRLGESAQFGEAHDQPGATKDRCRYSHPEILVDPLGGQRGEIIGGELDDALVLAPIVVRLLKIAGARNTKLKSAKRLGDFQGATAV